jgi:hypothetical protein
VLVIVRQGLSRPSANVEFLGESMRTFLVVAAFSTVLAAGVVFPGAASAADDPRTGDPQIGPCHAKVDKIRFDQKHAGSTDAAGTDTPSAKDASSAKDAASTKDRVDPQDTNNRSLTTGVYLKCK